MDRTQEARDRMAKEDPQLAARLFLQMLPAVAQRLSGPLAYDINIDDLGTWHVAVDGNGGAAQVVLVTNGATDFELHADAAGVAALAAGRSPLRLMMSGRLKLTGKRRRALKLRALANGPEPTIADALNAGAELDADAIYRALPYLVDPDWTRGHSFTLVHEVEGAGVWSVRVDDGQPLAVAGDVDDPDARIR